jgi:hypothetical protein
MSLPKTPTLQSIRGHLCSSFLRCVSTCAGTKSNSRTLPISLQGHKHNTRPTAEPRGRTTSFPSVHKSARSEEKLPQSSARRSGIFERSSWLAGLSLHRALYEPSRPPRRLLSPGRQEVGRSDAFEASLAPATISLPRCNSPQPAELNKIPTGFIPQLWQHLIHQEKVCPAAVAHWSTSLPWLSQTSAGENSSSDVQIYLL